MSVLRIRCSLAQLSLQCEWRVNAGSRIEEGAGDVNDAPGGAARVEWIVPASDVSLTRAALPRTARRRGSAVLAYAAEDDIAGDPDTQYVTRLGRIADEDVLAVLDRARYARSLDALSRAGLAPDAIYCETLLLPCAPDEWSIAWNGHEGFVRTGALEGAATDAGDRQVPPLALKLMLDAAHARGSLPQRLALYTTAADAAPDLESWQAELGIPLWQAGAWDWRSAPVDTNARLTQEGRGPARVAHIGGRLVPAAWLVAVALVVHAAGVAIDWATLASDRRDLQSRMEARFRAVFPEAVAVADPALQMRRKLAEKRRAISRPDTQDFLPMIGRLAPAVKLLPAGTLRLIAYDGERLTVQVRGAGEAALRAFDARLKESGLLVQSDSKKTTDGNAVLTVVEGR